MRVGERWDKGSVGLPLRGGFCRGLDGQMITLERTWVESRGHGVQGSGAADVEDLDRGHRPRRAAIAIARSSSSSRT